MLTAQQLASLRQDLITLAVIEYDDILHEILDHYASLTEQKMAKGMPFKEASQWSWAELGSGEGIQQIQTTYEKSIRKQVGNQHIRILKGYFRWPALLTTFLVALLIYLTVPLLSSRAIGTILFVLTFFPITMIAWGYFRFVDQRISTGKIIWQYMQQKGVWLANFSIIVFDIPGIFFETGSQRTRLFLEAHPSASVLLCLLFLLYTVSFIQLYWHKFHLKIA